MFPLIPLYPFSSVLCLVSSSLNLCGTKALTALLTLRHLYNLFLSLRSFLIVFFFTQMYNAPEMKEIADGSSCLALEMEKDAIDDGERVFPGRLHDKDGLAPRITARLPSEGSRSPLQLDAQSRPRPKILMQVLIIFCVMITSINFFRRRLGIYSAAIISFLLALSQAVSFHGPSILTQPTGHLSDYTQAILVEYTNFRDLADAVTASLILPLGVAGMELVMTDMRVMIQFSNLKARKAMLLPVHECILEAKNATRGLQRLTSKIGGAVDRYAQTNHSCFCQHLSQCYSSPGLRFRKPGGRTSPYLP